MTSSDLSRPWSCGIWQKRPDLLVHVRLVEDLAEVEALGLPVVDGLPRLEAVDVADHLLDRAEAELGHDAARASSAMKRMKLTTCSGLPVNFARSCGILRRDARRAGVQVADAHHDAAGGDQRRGGEAELLGAEQRGDHDVAAGLQLAVGLDGDAAAQVVEDERLVGLGQAELPGQARVRDRGLRRGARAAVVAADEHDVGVRLGDAGGDRADADLGDQLHADARVAVAVLQVVDQLGQVLDRVDVVVRRRAR